MYKIDGPYDNIIFSVFISKENVIIERNLSKQNKLLRIEKKNLNIKLIEKNDFLTNEVFLKSLKIKGILGIISILNLNYLVFITEQNWIANFKNESIFRIKDVYFLCLSDSNEKLEIETNKIIKGITAYILSGFYFSFKFDLTNTFERQCTNQKDVKDLFISGNRDFIWNYNLCLDFLSLQEIVPLTDWLVPVICGYVGSINMNLFDSNLNLFLISRRSTLRAGTRYITRGIDDDGNVGNYLETELIVFIKDQAYSYVQLRGSSPIFFEQNEILGQTKILRSPEMSCSAFSKHFNKIYNSFEIVLCINLLNKKSSEICITETYEKVIKLVKNKYEKCLFYEYFDYNKEISGNKFSVENFIFKVERQFPITHFILNNESKQKNVIRTNCLDSLDRTNLIQTRIGWLVLRNMLSSFSKTEDFKRIFYQNFLNPDYIHELLGRFKTLWIENGDAISNQYSGTDSTSSFVAKNGYKGILGLFNTAKIATQRFYEGTINDGTKQKCIEILLQKNKNKISYFETEIKKKCKLKIHIVSWCISGKEIPINVDLNKLIFPNSEICDVYIFGFQKILNVKLSNLFTNKTKEAISKLRSRLYETLSSKEDYVILKEIDLEGLYLVVLVKYCIKDDFSNIDHSLVNLSLIGQFGSIGNILIRFEYKTFTFALCCSRFQAKNSNTTKRINELSYILSKNIGKYNQIFSKYDYAFLFGSFNFRLFDSDKSISNCLENDNFKDLIEYDELLSNISDNSIKIIKEAKIEFKPTRKYMLNSNQYVKNCNKIYWADRILWIENKDIENCLYNSADEILSEHKPIYAQFVIILN